MIKKSMLFIMLSMFIFCNYASAQEAADKAKTSK